MVTESLTCVTLNNLLVQYSNISIFGTEQSIVPLNLSFPPNSHHCVGVQACSIQMFSYRMVGILQSGTSSRHCFTHLIRLVVRVMMTFCLLLQPSVRGEKQRSRLSGWLEVSLFFPH